MVAARGISDDEIYKNFNKMTIGEFLSWVELNKIDNYVDERLQQIVIDREKRKTFWCAISCAIFVVITVIIVAILR